MGNGERVRRQAKTELGSWYNTGSFELMKQTGGSIAKVMAGHWVGGGQWSRAGQVDHMCT